MVVVPEPALVGEHLGVGEPAVVVDADVDVVVADVVAALAQEGPLAGAALDPPEPLDVDMHELARPRALVPERLLEPEPAEPPMATPAQDPGDGRERHPERL